MDVTKHLLRTELYIGDPFLEALVPFIEFGAELYIGDPFLEARVPFLEFGVEQRVGDLFLGASEDGTNSLHETGDELVSTCELQVGLESALTWAKSCHVPHGELIC